MNIDTIKGRGIPLRGDEIDTDRIIPARFLLCVTFDELGKEVFKDERFTAQGEVKSHPFNQDQYQGASILVVNRNFGCGSSREHAPQALYRWGIRALVGISFADIFAGNCAAIGLPAVTADAGAVEALQDLLEREPSIRLTVDLQGGTLGYTTRDGIGHRLPVFLSPAQKQKFTSGTWDSTAILLENRSAIEERATKIPYLGFYQTAQVQEKASAKGWVP